MFGGVSHLLKLAPHVIPDNPYEVIRDDVKLGLK